MNAQLTEMTTRELIMALSQVEEAIRLARFPGRDGGQGTPSSADDLIALIRQERRIVNELRLRRNATGQDATRRKEHAQVPAEAS
jgi:hypothetical protein